MRIVAHVSDLHFGAADARIAAALASHLRQLAPDVVAISGDLTQRARRDQFREAHAYLAQLPSPRIVVPGNHDIPLYNVLARFAYPRAAFYRHITRERHPYYEDEEIAVMGADTTRSITIKDGGLRPLDVQQLASQLTAAGGGRVRIVVCHHPFDAPRGAIGRLTWPRPATRAVAELVSNGADILLTGHLHASYTGGTAIRYRANGRTAIVVEAGTATSTRVRGEPNAFNVLRVDLTRIVVERLVWQAATSSFATTDRQTFTRKFDGWA
ncbi:MAG TPA: metallophosphoesterase [Vicinamibacterales bacterium]|jgi:3',5'-cyclic AMP phosphodiesterase CpdA|nr:metallophosphoesterase [Vicinamibacterales bacterium]